MSSEPPIIDELPEALESAARPRAASAPPERSGRRRVLLGAVMLALFASGAVAALGASGMLGQGTISPQAWVEGQRVQPATRASPQQITALPMLGRPRSAFDALSASQQHALTHTPAAARGLSVIGARRARGFADGGAWVIPGNADTVCVLADNAQGLAMSQEHGPWQQHKRLPGANGLMGCTTAAAVAKGWSAGYGYTSDAPGDYFTAGLVPPAIRQVVVSIAGGRHVGLPASEGVYIGQLPAPPVAASFQGAGGPVTIGR